VLGISKLTAKIMAREIHRKEKEIGDVLERNKLSLESMLTESEILMYLKQIPGLNLGVESFSGFLRVLNLSLSQQLSPPSSSQSVFSGSAVHKLSVREILARCRQLLDQMHSDKESEGGLLGQQLVRKLKDAVYLKAMAVEDMF